MENQEVSSKEIVTFYYHKLIRRLKRLENNVFVTYSPERIELQPGETKSVNMGIKIKFSNIEAGCRILYSLSNYNLKLLNSNMISQEMNLHNFLIIDENNLPPWSLTCELFNKSFTETLQIRKRQDIGYFFIRNDRGKEIDFKYVKES